MSNIIAGRSYEQKEMLDTFNSKIDEFMIVYGRRRIKRSRYDRGFILNNLTCPEHF